MRPEFPRPGGVEGASRGPRGRKTGTTQSRTDRLDGRGSSSVRAPTRTLRSELRERGLSSHCLLAWFWEKEKNRVHINSRLPAILFDSPVALGRENRAVRLWILGVGPGGYMRLNHWYELGDGDRDMDADK